MSGGLSANRHDLYASAEPGQSPVGARILVGQEVAPRKWVSNTALNYAILFDDVSPSAATTTFSGIGTDAAGTFYLKSRNNIVTLSDTGFQGIIGLSGGGNITITTTGGQIILTSTGNVVMNVGPNTYILGNAADPGLFVNGQRWLGGMAGPFGTATNPVPSNTINIGPNFTTDVLMWSRVGNVVNCQFTITFDVPITAAASIEYTFNEMIAMTPVPFATANSASGQGQFQYQGVAPSTDTAQSMYIFAVPATNRIIFTTAGLAAIGAVGRTLQGQFSFIATD